MAGSELLRLVEVMDRLRSPGGCPWDAEQTHESLIKSLLEESYEFIDAVETNDRAGLQEELGDLLLQVYLVLLTRGFFLNGSTIDIKAVVHAH